MIEKIYNKKDLESKTNKELKEICKEKGISYYRLRKQEMIENICCFGKGKKIPHKARILSWEDIRHGKHKMTFQIKKFCYEFVMSRTKRTHAGWAKRFGVSVPTIRNWLGRGDVIELMGEFHEKHRQRVKQFFEQNEEEVIGELLKIAKNRKFSDLKRKAIVDYLGFAGVPNVNAGTIRIKQQQVQGQIQREDDMSKMSDEDLDKEIRELEELGE